MRANVEKRKQRTSIVLQKTEQIKEDAKARREKFEEEQQRKKASLVSNTNNSEKPVLSRRQSSIPAGPSKTAEVSPTKKIKLADKTPVTETKGSSRVPTEEPLALKPTSVVDCGAEVDESPLFYPLPVGRKQEEQAEKEHSPVTSKSQLVKT